jgi:hypothetical protein
VTSSGRLTPAVASNEPNIRFAFATTVTFPRNAKLIAKIAVLPADERMMGMRQPRLYLRAFVRRRRGGEGSIAGEDARAIRPGERAPRGAACIRATSVPFAENAKLPAPSVGCVITLAAMP